MRFLYLDKNTFKVIKYPVFADEIRKDFPYLSFADEYHADAVVDAINCLKDIPYIVQIVAEKSKPDTLPFTDCIETDPVNIGGAWVQSWIVEDHEIHEAKEQAIENIDITADEVRKVLMGTETTIVEYDVAAKEAKDFSNSGYFGMPGLAVSSWAEIRGITYAEAADEIIEKNKSFYEIIYKIRACRLGAKDTIRDSFLMDQIRSTYIDCIKELMVLRQDAKELNGG